MIGKILLSTLFAIFVQARHHDIEPLPGSISASLNVTSLNNILQLAAPLMASELLNDKTFKINYHKKGWKGIYNIDIEDVHFNKVDGFDVRDISFKEGTDTIMVTVGGVNVNATCDAKVSGLWVITAGLEAFTVENITLQLEVSTSSADEVHWQLHEVTRLSLQDLTLTMSNDFWQTLVNENIKLIKIGIAKGLQKLIDMVDSKVAAFNLKLASDKPYTYNKTPLVDNLLLNTTMTKYPELSREQNLINIHMDGLYVFHTEEHIDVPDPNTVWPIGVEDGHQRDQIWIHESTLNSVVYDHPITITGRNATKEALKHYPELELWYGTDFELKLNVSFLPHPLYGPKMWKQIDVNNVTGLHVGDLEDGGLITAVRFLCSNATTEEEVAMETQFGIGFN